MPFWRFTAVKIKRFFFLIGCHLQAHVLGNPVPATRWPHLMQRLHWTFFLMLRRGGLYDVIFQLVRIDLRLTVLACDSYKKFDWLKCLSRRASCNRGWFETPSCFEFLTANCGICALCANQSCLFLISAESIFAKLFSNIANLLQGCKLKPSDGCAFLATNCVCLFAEMHANHCAESYQYTAICAL